MRDNSMNKVNKLIWFIALFLGIFAINTFADTCSPIKLLNYNTNFPGVNAQYFYLLTTNTSSNACAIIPIYYYSNVTINSITVNDTVPTFVTKTTTTGNDLYIYKLTNVPTGTLALRVTLSASGTNTVMGILIYDNVRDIGTVSVLNKPAYNNAPLSTTLTVTADETGGMLLGIGGVSLGYVLQSAEVNPPFFNLGFIGAVTGYSRLFFAECRNLIGGNNYNFTSTIFTSMAGDSYTANYCVLNLLPQTGCDTPVITPSPTYTPTPSTKLKPPRLIGQFITYYSGSTFVITNYSKTTSNDLNNINFIVIRTNASNTLKDLGGVYNTTMNQHYNFLTRTTTNTNTELAIYYLYNVPSVSYASITFTTSASQRIYSCLLYTSPSPRDS